MPGLPGRVRIGVIGAGSMGSLHARVVAESSGAELSCVIDPDQDIGRALATQHGSPWFRDLDRTDLVDAVIVASSTETHRDWVEKALRARKPILVEKPMSTNLDDSRAMADGAVAAGMPITCGFVERFNPAVMLAMDVVEAPLAFRATRHSPFTSRVRTGVVHDLMIHDADLAIRMFGEPPDTISSRLGYLHPESAADAEDVADAELEFPSGGIARLSASRITPRKIRTIAISESDRVLEIDLMRKRLTIYRHVANGPTDGNGAYRARTVVEHPAIPLLGEPLATQLEHFLALIGGAVDADAERRSVLLAHEALATALGGNIVDGSLSGRGATVVHESRSQRPTLPSRSFRRTVQPELHVAGLDVDTADGRRRHASDDRQRRDVVDHDRAGTYHRPIANGDAHQHNRSRADEDVIPDRDGSTVDGWVLASADTPAHRGVGVDLGSGSDVTAATDPEPTRTVDDGEGADPGSFADLGATDDGGGGVVRIP